MKGFTPATYGVITPKNEDFVGSHGSSLFEKNNNPTRSPSRKWRYRSRDTCRHSASIGLTGGRCWGDNETIGTIGMYYTNIYIYIPHEKNRCIYIIYNAWQKNRVYIKYINIILMYCIYIYTHVWRKAWFLIPKAIFFSSRRKSSRPKRTWRTSLWLQAVGWWVSIASWWGQTLYLQHMHHIMNSSVEQNHPKIFHFWNWAMNLMSGDFWSHEFLELDWSLSKRFREFQQKPNLALSRKAGRGRVQHVQHVAEHFLGSLPSKLHFNWHGSKTARGTTESVLDEKSLDVSSWWFQMFFIFTPKTGEMIHFD